MSRRFVRAALPAALALVLCEPALASEDNPPKAAGVAAEEDEAPAPASRPPADKATLLDSLTLTARRTKGDVLSYPGAVSVVPAEAIAREQVGNMVDIIHLVPGVNLDFDVGRDIGRNFSIRGFGFADEERVIVKVDGARRSFNFANQVSTFAIDPDMLQETEVVRGASSVVHGGGALGGVVEMRTKDARDLLDAGEQVGARLRLGYNSNNRQHAAAYLYGTTGRRDADWLVAGSLTRARSHALAGGREVSNRNDKYDGMLKLRWAPDAANELHLKLHGEKMRVHNPWNTLWHLSEWANTVISGVYTQNDVTFNYFHKGQAPWLDVSVDAYWNKSEYDRQAHDLDPAVRGTAGEFTGLIDQNVYAGIGAQNVARFDALGGKHVLQFGLDATARWQDQFNKFTGAYTLLGPTSERDYGIYLQDSLYYGARQQLELIVAARYDRFERQVGRLTQPLPEESSATYRSSRVSPRVGIGWQALEWLRVFGNYSEVFRAPSSFELYAVGPGNPWTYWVPNLALEAETGKEAELGMALDLGEATGLDALKLKANVFRGEFRDFITLTDIDPRPAIPGDTRPGGSLRNRLNQYQNLNRVNRRGVELEAAVAQGNWRSELVYSTLKVWNPTTGRDVPHAFADKLLWSVGYVIEPAALDLSWRINYYFAAPNTPATNASGQPLIDKSFKTHDFFVSWRPEHSAWQVSGGVRNVFDQPLITPGRPANSIWHGIGRSVFADISYRF